MLYPTELPSQEQSPVLFLNLFLERGEGREKDRERNIDGCLSHTPTPETEPKTQARALTGNQTRDLLLGKTVPDQLSHLVRARVPAHP